MHRPFQMLPARNPALDAVTLARDLVAGTRGRLVGPGGLYNAGNAVGLAMGIGLQVAVLPAESRGLGEILAATFGYLGGNPAALALTGATAIFFVSGEAYHRAWAHGAPPVEALNRRGDLLSGIGALVLGLALLGLGQVALALTAGLLHALGKFGSAGHWRPLRGWRRDWPDFWRSLVLASRIPAVLATVLGLLDLLAAGAPTLALLTPLTLLVCYAFWCRADLMLLAPAR